MSWNRLRRDALGGDLVALLVVFIWGVNFVFVKAAFEQFDVAVFTLLRYAAMLVMGWGVLAFRPSSAAELRSISRSDWPQLVLAGALGFTLYIPLSMIGLGYTTAFANALLIALAPLFMAVLLWLRRSEPIRRGHVLGLAVSLLGTGVFVSDALTAGSLRVGLGDLISLLAALFYAAYNVANKPLVVRYPATVVTTVTLTIGALPVMALFAPALAHQDWHRVTAEGWAALGFSAVFPVFLAWTLWGWANARVGVARTSLFMYLVPLFSGAASWLLLREVFTVQKVARAAVIVAALALTRLLAQGVASLRRHRAVSSAQKWTV